MAKKLILVAPNSYKECTDSVTAANLLTDSLNENLNKYGISDYRIVTKPISDGGDGFLDVCDFYFGIQMFPIEITFPWGNEKFLTIVGYSDKNKTVFVESAFVLGLNIIPVEKRNPLKLNSVGLGEVLKYLNELKRKNKLDFEKVVIGIGGTGTSDLGIGMCSTFGMKLLDEYGKIVEPFPVNFKKVKSIVWEKPNLFFEIEIIIDVDNPLLGEKGANRVFAGQKGASENDIEILENGFSNILRIVGANKTGWLSGAGGGLAAAFQHFYDAKIIFARDFIKNDLGINKNLLKPSILITGEGKIDKQTLLDKGAMIVLNEFSESECIKILIVGVSKTKLKNVHTIELSKYFSSVQQSIKNFEKGFELAAKEITEHFFV